jgi:hypothetical protein
MAHTGVADGGVVTQIYRVAKNLLNKQQQTATRGAYPPWV